MGVRGRTGEGVGERWGAQAAGARRRWGAQGALGRREAGGHAGVARGRGAQAAWALGRWAAQAQARGALERAGAWQGARAVGARTEGQGRAGWAAGARPGRWARGLGLGWP